LRSSGACPPPVRRHKERRLLPPCARPPAATPQVLKPKLSCRCASTLRLELQVTAPLEMGVLNIRINQRLLHCRHCHRRRQPPLPPADTHCFLLDRIIHQMRFKCNFCDSGYIPYSKFLVHLCDTTPAHLMSVFARGECILATSALVCSECGLPLRPPIFRASSALPCPD
jgi:hypothetical protein